MRENVVLIYADDTPPDTLDFLPTLSEGYKGHWVRLPNAKIVIPVCTPSRTATLTGLFPPNNGVTTNNANAYQFHDLSIGRMMQRAGYRTAIMGKYLNWWHTDPTWMASGWDDWRVLWGNHVYYDYALNENGVLVEYGSDPEDYLMDVLAGHALDFLSTAPDPFFLYFPIYTPHGNRTAAPRHLGMHDDVTPARRPNYNDKGTNPPAWLGAYEPPAAPSSIDKMHRQAYDCLQALDEAIEAIIDLLDSRGVLDNTVIIFLGDNGNHFLEHGYVGKSTPYEEALDPNMIVRWPGVDEGVNPALIGNVDLAPTLARIARTAMPYASDGMDFGPVIRGEIAPEDFRHDLFIMIGGQPGDVDTPWRGIVHWDGTAYEKYIEYDAGYTQRHDLVADPYELVNLAGDGGLARRLDIVDPRTA